MEIAIKRLNQRRASRLKAEDELDAVQARSDPLAVARAEVALAKVNLQVAEAELAVAKEQNDPVAVAEAKVAVAKAEVAVAEAKADNPSTLAGLRDMLHNANTAYKQFLDARGVSVG